MVQAGAVSYDPTTNKIRSYISWINSSTSRVDELKRRLRHNGLQERTFHHLDNKIRWNSTFLMLTNFLSEHYVNVIVSYINSEHGDDAITEYDIKMAESFVSFLDVFYKETCYLSAVYTPTSFLGLHTMTTIAVHFDKYKHETIFEDCIQAMRAKFLKLGAGKVPLLYGLGVILHCRCKIGGLKKFLKYIRKHFEDQDYIALDLARIVQALYDLFRVYEAKLLP